MLLKAVKIGILSSIGAVVIGGLVFGSDLVSYVRTSARSVQSSVKESVPMAFELQRARDLLNDIIPEMHANVRLIAQEEVELVSLRTDIAKSTKTIADERSRVQRLRESLAVTQPAYLLGNVTYSHDQLKDELARRFEMLKEGEIVLAGKQRLLDTRGKSLAAAMQALDRTRSQKSLLESQIALLESQHRLIQSAAVGTSVQIDNSKLAQTEKLIAQIKKQLDVAERVLAHESHFVQPVVADGVNEKDLLAQIDEHLNPTKPTPHAE